MSFRLSPTCPYLIICLQLIVCREDLVHQELKCCQHRLDATGLKKTTGVGTPFREHTTEARRSGIMTVPERHSALAGNLHSLVLLASAAVVPTNYTWKCNWLHSLPFPPLIVSLSPVGRIPILSPHTERGKAYTGHPAPDGPSGTCFFRSFSVFSSRRILHAHQ